MNTLRKWIFIAAMGFCSSTLANTFMSDYSDLWWNASESGWGVTVTHQREVIFLTFFVYGTDGKPSWYTGQAAYSNTTLQGAQVFTGQMFQTSGPWFGTFFNPAAVTNRLVGNMTFSAFLNSATLTYSIDGVTVNKSVTRQTFRANDLTGAYTGALRQIQSGCASGAVAGTYVIPATISVTHNGNSLVLIIQTADDLCAYGGDYTQSGRIGNSSGQFTCASPSKGTYQLVEVEAGVSGITGRYTASGNFCSTVTGRFSVVKN